MTSIILKKSEVFVKKTLQKHEVSKFLKIDANDDSLKLIINDIFSLELVNNIDNLKVFNMLLSLIKVIETGKSYFTHQEIAESTGYSNRQNVHNYIMQFDQSGKDIKTFLTRKSFLKEESDKIRKQFINNLLLSIDEHYETYCNVKSNPKISKQTFLSKIEQLNSVTIIKKFQSLFNKNHINQCIDINHHLELLMHTKKIDKKIDPDIKRPLKPNKEENPYIGSEYLTTMDKSDKSILVNYLSASGLNFETISLLLGVSKGTVSNLFHQIKDLQALLINSIEYWSGKISIDEKYIKLNKVPYYVLTIVDFDLGIPLYQDIYSNTKTEAYQHCFQMFKLHYGIPRLIVSDGSKPLFKARMKVFPQTPHQLCKFHKLRNLIKDVYKSNIPDYLKQSYKDKILKVFRRQSSKSIKKGLKNLVKILPENLAKHISERILKNWSFRRKGLTSNVSERYNRKIKKAVSGRYGLKNLDTARQIVFSLWMKELILHGRQQLHTESMLYNLNISKICQEKIQWKKVGSLFTKTLDTAISF
ncbi:MAG: transposase [Desulfurella sp.]